MYITLVEKRRKQTNCSRRITEIFSAKCFMLKCTIQPRSKVKNPFNITEDKKWTKSCSTEFFSSRTVHYSRQKATKTIFLLLVNFKT